jgi:hypothetical protein
VVKLIFNNMPFIDPDRPGTTFLRIFAVEFAAIIVVYGILALL